MSAISFRESDFNSDKAAVLAEIELIPLEDDLDTIAAIRQVSIALKNDSNAFEGYRLAEAEYIIDAESGKTRGSVELFQLVSGFAQNVHDPQGFLEILIGAGLATLRLLLKYRRIKKLEITLGEKTLVLENADQRVVQTAMQQFEDLCREESNSITSSSKIKFKAQVSKKST